MGELEKTDSDIWLFQLAQIDENIERLEYELRVQKACRGILETIAKNHTEKCSHSGCKKLARYKSKSESGAIFYYCYEHVPPIKKVAKVDNL